MDPKRALFRDAQRSDKPMTYQPIKRGVIRPTVRPLKLNCDINPADYSAPARHSRRQCR